MTIKDIEEEIGIDLVTLAKVIKNGIYLKLYSGKIVYQKIIDVDINCGIIIGLKTEDNYWIGFENFNITWSLTKEELER